MSERIIAIFGSGGSQPDDDAFKLAEKIGLLLAEAGFTIINGGYGGTMLAAAKSSSRAGGKTIGVTCKAFGAGRANKYISREIVTETLDERLFTLIKTAQAYIVLPGSTGTLLELAKVWELKNKGFINNNKPVILLGGFWKPLVDLMKAEDAGCIQYIQIIEEPERVIETLKQIFD
jgi:uncharacterized protein (TIGR00730 family)